ncbi:MAG: prepilin-type N-terminal cleavage/methylation domain-containing protein [Planctomycetota bacterium]|nr:prepilin-type N-terminal cleavage/methylation domain-containing protein [Planctomycetota bacterium]
MRAMRGFTLLEMMIVVAVSLMIMVLVVPIFQVTTRTVKTVERKLALYEAARNILDILEFEIRLVARNERGEAFSIKSLTFPDNDPNKLVSPPGSTKPGVLDVNRRGYRESRREADVASFARHQGGGFRYAMNLNKIGSMAYPLAYPEQFNRTPEAWKASIRSTLAYPRGYMNGTDNSVGYIPSRTSCIDNVRLTEVEEVAHPNNPMHNSWSDTFDFMDHLYDSFAPGNEVKLSGVDAVPPMAAGRTGTTCEDAARVTEGFANAGDDAAYAVRRSVGDINLTDLDISYWDDATGSATRYSFQDPPDNCAVYFWPTPKAVRITISVCDLDKRGVLSICRIVHLPVGLGNQVIDNTFDPAQVRLDRDMYPYNRAKLLNNPRNGAGSQAEVGQF